MGAQVGRLFQDIRAKNTIFSEESASSSHKNIIVKSESNFADQISDIVKAFENIRITRLQQFKAKAKDTPSKLMGVQKGLSVNIGQIGSWIFIQLPLTTAFKVCYWKQQLSTSIE